MKAHPTQAVLLCGGLGTRLRPLTDTMPKPMAPISADRPFLHYLLEQLSDQGVKNFVLLTGYKAEAISDYFGDGGKWGWDISYSEGPVEWDTGKRLWEARDLLNQQFLLLYSDNFCQFRLGEMCDLHTANKSTITLVLKKKPGGNVSLGPNNRLQKYDKSRNSDNLDYVELGYMVAEREPVLDAYAKVAGAPDISFSDVLAYLVANHTVSGRPLETPYYSISDPDRLKLMRDHLSPKKIVFLDRDGTIHKRAPRGEYTSRWEDVELLPDAVRGLVELARQGFKFAVITNQAGIGRGVVAREAVEQLNNCLKEHLGSLGIEILKFYLCPHHWEDDCSCRKPKPGMFYECASDLNLRLDQTIYIGDDPRDVMAANAAGASCLYVGNPSELEDTELSDQRVFSSILDCVEEVVSTYSID